jgi:imidazoleglycerol phosphate dehydratase HisB
MKNVPARPRVGEITRQTRETRVLVRLSPDGSGTAEIGTGIGFLDHLLSTLAFHSRFDILLECKGDLGVDDHHTAEDCALALGQALDAALGDRGGIERFGFAYAPLDEALARAVIDLSGRPSAHVELGLVRPAIGEIASENVAHVLSSFATAARAGLHVDVIKGRNDHHRAEAAFKALALALRAAVSVEGRQVIPSTKGTL